MKLLLKNANAYIDGRFTLSDILIKDGTIAEILPSGSGTPEADTTVIDLSGKHIFPGLVDVHVHFREPGFSYKETIETGSLAAARGGYTDVCPMPNLSPVPDSPEHLEEELKLIRDQAVINVIPYGSLTIGQKGAAAADIEGMKDDVCAFSDDGTGVEDDAIMEDVMNKCKAVNKLAVAHCEFKGLMGGKNLNEGLASKALGTKGISCESEWKMIERDIGVSKKTGCGYHVCHVSTAESVKLIREAKKAGVNISCESAPHYFLLDEEVLLKEPFVTDKGVDSVKREVIDILKKEAADDDKNAHAGCSECTSSDVASATHASASATHAADGLIRDEKLLGRFKMNPPLRGRADREELLKGLLDGTIDMIATDHAPHSNEEKERGIMGAPLGVTGLECAFPVLYTGLVKTGVLTLERLLDLMTSAPAKRFGIESGIKAGSKAKLCAYDLNERYIIRGETFASKGHFTPFEGVNVYGKCLFTVYGDSIIKNT
ncbi:MAG: dihydroorotase [Lachnospiraceae bacterium]|nr:dihydroorotase [Lachnospiraceae bacterium]